MKPTIKDVAKEAKVSVATISRILNGLGGYSEETEKKVLKVIEEMGYHRNAIARGLIMKSTQTIGVLVPNVSTMFYAELLNGIWDTADKSNYSIVICNTGTSGKKTMEYLKVLAERQVDGLIVTSLNPLEQYDKAINKMNIPCILISTLSYRHQIPYVKVDDFQAAYTATKYLIEKGHKDIAMISGFKEDPIAGRPRLNGYKQALSDCRLNINDRLIKYGDFSYKDGIKCMEQLLKEKERFTAVFAASDDMAVGALSTAYSNGISVPDDISVIGYDNTKAAEMAIPPLTTVAQPLYDMGVKAIEMLLGSISNSKIAESIIMPYKIIERSSVKQLK